MVIVVLYRYRIRSWSGVEFADEEQQAGGAREGAPLSVADDYVWGI